MSENEWKDVKEELPPCDGYYEVDTGYVSGISYYCGFGFDFAVSSPVLRWKQVDESKKKYGKVKDA